MNRKNVIIWMTLAVISILFILSVSLLGTIPPLPIWVFFGISHGFFCVMVYITPNYKGPYKKPLTEP